MDSSLFAVSSPHDNGSPAGHAPSYTVGVFPECYRDYIDVAAMKGGGSHSVTQFIAPGGATEMSHVACDWHLEVDRGPDWLFVRVRPPVDADTEPDLASSIWELLEKHFTYRVVLEMDEVDMLSSHLIGQLILLQKRIHQHDGVLRLCGLGEQAIESLHLCRLDGGLPNYRDREDAVMGARPHAK